MMNKYKALRVGSYTLAGLIPLLLFSMVMIFYSFPIALVFSMLGILMSLAIGLKMTSHPIIGMLEGKGILTLSIDSTGQIIPYICPVSKGTVIDPNGNETIFNRENVTYLNFPKGGNVQLVTTVDSEGNAKTEKHIVIPDDPLGYRFGFSGLPVFLWNENLQTFIHKDFLATFELATVKLSLVRGIDHKVSNLSSQIKDFTRYVMDQIKPKKSFPIGGAIAGLLVFAVIIGVIFILFGGGGGVGNTVGSLVQPK